jgi:hypothetical protein
MATICELHATEFSVLLSREQFELPERSRHV